MWGRGAVDVKVDETVDHSMSHSRFWSLGIAMILYDTTIDQILLRLILPKQ